MKNIEDSRAGPARCPYDIARGTRAVLRIIRPNHKCTVVSSRTGPVVWCDHENSTDVKFLRALHSALRARNRTGDKNRTGPVVGCDWVITQWRQGCSRHSQGNPWIEWPEIWRADVSCSPPGLIRFFAYNCAKKWGKSTDHDKNLVSCEGGQDSSACQIPCHSSHSFSWKCPETPNLTCFIESK